MKNTFGSAVSMTIFGESHGPAVGAVLGFFTSPIVVVVAAGVAGLCVRAAKGGLKQ